jgi:hypothetical protein
MKTKTNQTTMQSIQTQVTEAMKQSFNESRQVLTKDEILSHLKTFASRKTKKAWLTKRINDRVVYLRLLKQASTEGWKHFYGQSIHQKFIELSMATLQSMIDIRLSLSPQAERESLIETFLGGLTKSEPKVQRKLVPVQPKVESKPKVVKQPKVVSKPSANDEVMAKIVNNLAELTNQVTKLTEMCVANSFAITELQLLQPKVAKEEPKVVKEQPKAEAKPKVSKKLPTAKEQPKVVKEAKRQPKVATGQINLFEALFKTNAPKSDKKSTISHTDAFEHRSDVEKGQYRKFRMEVF